MQALFAHWSARTGGPFYALSEAQLRGFAACQVRVKSQRTHDFETIEPGGLCHNETPAIVAVGLGAVVRQLQRRAGSPHRKEFGWLLVTLSGSFTDAKVANSTL
jgi:hypothetical protein